MHNLTFSGAGFLKKESSWQCWKGGIAPFLEKEYIADKYYSVLAVMPLFSTDTQFSQWIQLLQYVK